MSAYSDLILAHANLISYWRLNEASGAVEDSKGSNDGTVTGATYGAVGIPKDGGTAMSFDGSNDLVEVAYSASLNPNGDYSIEFWFYNTVSGTNRSPFTSQAEDFSAGYALFINNTESINANWRNNAGGDSTVAYAGIKLNTWYHVVMVFDSSSGQVGVGRLYLNGVLVGSTASFTHVVNTTGPMRFGRGANTAVPHWFAGRVDEVAFYNAALDAATVKSHYIAGTNSYDSLILSHPNLSSYWRLGESSGNLIDGPGSSDFTTVTGATYSAAGLAFETDTAMSFDGVNDIATTPFDSKFDPSGASWSVELWAMCTGGAGTYRSPISFRDGATTAGWLIYAAQNGRWEFWVAHNAGGWNGESTNGGPFVVLNRWIHLVGVWNSTGASTGSLSFYANGKLAYTSGVFTHNRNTSQILSIGARNDSGSWFPGKIDEVAFYNAALDEATILSHYLGGVPAVSGATVDTGAIVGGGSGNTGWNSRSTFAVEDVGDFFEGNPNNSVANVKSAQSFVATGSYDVSAVVLNLLKVGSPTGTSYVTIEANSGGYPSGTALGTSNTISHANEVSTVSAGVVFTFPSPISLTNGTTYHLVYHRGADDTRWALNDAGVGGVNYANGVMTWYDGSSWSTPSASYDHVFILLKPSKSYYQITQDSKLHIWKSTDLATWIEQDPANAPLVNSSSKPFNSDFRWDTRGLTILADCRWHGMYVGYFSGANTARVRRFDTVTGWWDGSDIGSADASTDVDFNRKIGLAATRFEIDLFYTSLADDADLEYVRFTSSWGAQTQVLAATHANSSSFADVNIDRTSRAVSDTARFVSAWFYDIAGGDFTVRTLTGTTLGTATDLDASAADAESEQAAANYQPYDDSGSDKVIVAFIDADGTLEEKICTIGVTSASIVQGTQHQISSSTSYAGQSLGSCKHGSDAFVFACSGSAIDVFRDIGIAGSWAVENWRTGLTNAVIGIPVSIPGVGILLPYTSNGNTIVDLWVATHPLTGTAIGDAIATASSLGVGHVLSGTMLGAAVASGLRIIESHAMSGEMIGDATGTLASLSVGHPLSGTMLGSAIVEGSRVSVGHVLSGSMIGDAIAEAVSISLEHPLSGEMVGDATGTAGSLAVGHPLSGEAIGSAIGTLASLSVGHSLAGDLIGDAIAEAVSISLEHPLSGSAAGSAIAEAAAIILEHPLSGEMIGSAVLEGFISGEIFLSGSAIGSAIAEANLSIGAAISGEAIGSAILSGGSIEVGHILSGDLIGDAEGTLASLSVGHILSGDLIGAGFAAADRVILEHPLAGDLLGDAILEGEFEEIAAAHPLSGEAIGSAIAAASEILVGHPLSGVLLGSAIAEAQGLGLDHPLSGVLEGEGFAAAEHVALSHPLSGMMLGYAEAFGERINVSPSLEGEMLGEGFADIVQISVGHPLSGEMIGYAQMAAVLGVAFIPQYVISAPRRSLIPIDSGRGGEMVILAGRRDVQSE